MAPRVRRNTMAIALRSEPSINVTPLIDVLLVLLIIFMVVAPSRPAQFETKIPAKPAGPPPPSPEDLLVVTVDDTHILSLNNLRLSIDDLESRLAHELADRTDRVVFLRAPRSLPYREVVDVIDRLKGAGAEPIGLQVDLLDT
jgi:biopolymer transport protein ExbD